MMDLRLPRGIFPCAVRDRCLAAAPNSQVGGEGGIAPIALTADPFVRKMSDVRCVIH